MRGTPTVISLTQSFTMRFLVFFSLIAGVMYKAAEVAASTDGGATVNPFEGYNVLVDPLFQTGASKESCIATKPTFSWV